MASLTPLCADTARERSDPMHGTALNVRRFLLVEHPGPWAFDALAESGIEATVRARIATATRAVGARTLMIRRHGRTAAQGDHAWAVADVAAGRIRWGRWAIDTDLEAALAALAEPSTGWSEEPTLLVCTHGRHDTCCAVRGRPVAEALVARHGDRVWECSHVGGDRFAANVVVLPDGTYYGGLDAPDAGDVIDRHFAGTVSTEHLRGSSLLPPVAQAAAVAVHERFGPGSARDVHTATIETTGDTWTVELACAGALPARVVAQVAARQASPAVLTCRAQAATAARTFVVTDLRVTRASASADDEPAGSSPA